MYRNTRILIVAVVVTAFVLISCGDPQERSHGSPSMRKKAQEQAPSDVAEGTGDVTPSIEEQLEEFMKPENYEPLIKPMVIEGTPPAGVRQASWDKLSPLMKSYGEQMEPTKAAQALRKVRTFLGTLPEQEAQVLKKLLGLR